MRRHDKRPLIIEDLVALIHVAVLRGLQSSTATMSSSKTRYTAIISMN